MDDKKLKDDKLEKRKENHPLSARSKAPSGKSVPPPKAAIGDMIYIKNQGSKHETRSPYVVTEELGEKISVRKLLNTQPERSKPLTFSTEKQTVDRKFIFRPSQDRSVITEDSFEEDTDDADDEESDEGDEDIMNDQKTKRTSDDHIWTPKIPADEDYLPYEFICQVESSGETETADDIPVPDDDTDVLDEIVTLDDDHNSGEYDDSGDTSDSDVTTNDESIDDNQDGVNEPDEENPDMERLRQHRKVKKHDTIRVFDKISDSWRTVVITSTQIMYYRKKGPYFNCRFENGEVGGFYFRPGDAWSIMEDQEQLLQLDGGITPDSLTPDTSPSKTDGFDSGGDSHAVLPHDDVDTPRQTRYKNREHDKKRADGDKSNRVNRVYNLRSATANPIDEFLDENYSDMDSVFGETQENFIDQFVMSRTVGEHANLGIPTGMQLHRERVHSLTEYLDIELVPSDRGFSDHVYKMTPEFETTRFRSASDPDLVGESPTSSRSKWYQTYQSLRNFMSCMGRLRFFKNRRRH